MFFLQCDNDIPPSRGRIDPVDLSYGTLGWLALALAGHPGLERQPCEKGHVGDVAFLKSQLWPLRSTRRRVSDLQDPGPELRSLAVEAADIMEQRRAVPAAPPTLLPVDTVQP